jgi:type II secretory pathway predicted ATPase ExeA
VLYESYYGLNRSPFLLTPDPEFLFMSKKHAVALAMLEYGLTSHSALCLITGEVGSGKTTLIRHLLKTLDDSYTVGVITNTHRSFGDLLTWVLAAFALEPGQDTKVTQYNRFVEFVARQHVAGKRTVLIVDESQNMDVETLEELRLLTNMNLADELLLQLILVGQPELGKTLAQPELDQFAQRISVEHHIKALDFNETRDYIEHRVRVAGGSPELFDRYACATVYYYSRGIPRSINNICDMALAYGFALEANPIGCEIVLEAVGSKPILQELAKRRPHTEEDERLREMVKEIKGVDIAEPESGGSG